MRKWQTGQQVRHGEREGVVVEGGSMPVVGFFDGAGGGRVPGDELVASGVAELVDLQALAVVLLVFAALVAVWAALEWAVK